MYTVSMRTYHERLRVYYISTSFELVEQAAADNGGLECESQVCGGGSRHEGGALVQKAGERRGTRECGGVQILRDNQGIKVALASNCVAEPKYIDMLHHFDRERVARK
jgi:hypothetical protein